MTQKRYAVLDRDGTIIVGHHYLSDPDKVELLPGVSSGLKQLRALGLGLVVVTNQSAIGRGFFDEAQLELIHERLIELLAFEGIVLDGLYFCPHTPEDNCACRKPKSGMLLRAAQELDFAPQNSFVVGDNVCDIELGKRVGATTFLVLTGYGAQVADSGTITPDYSVSTMQEVAQIIHRLLTVSKERSDDVQY